jgi:two-component system response regulator MprA
VDVVQTGASRAPVTPVAPVGRAEVAPPGRSAGPPERQRPRVTVPCWADACVLRYGDLALHPDTRGIRRGHRDVVLTRLEFDLLELLLQNPHVVLTREVIFDRVWGYDFETTSNTLNVHVGSLRRKLESGGEPRLIQTVHGVGYVLRDEPQG